MTYASQAVSAQGEQVPWTLEVDAIFASKTVRAIQEAYNAFIVTHKD